MSDNTVMYTPSILKYNVSFQPNPSVGNYTPDKIVFKNVSQLLITMTSTGQQCQVKERGGIPARKRRIGQRKKKLPIEKDSNASVKNDKEKQEEKNEKIENSEEEEKVAKKTDIANKVKLEEIGYININNIKDENGNAKIEEFKKNIKEKQNHISL